jgi:hypothetical protein
MISASNQWVAAILPFAGKYPHLDNCKKWSMLKFEMSAYPSLGKEKIAPKYHSISLEEK